jgi:RNA polymerase sigma-70 factor (ECF subfamily)
MKSFEEQGAEEIGGVNATELTLAYREYRQRVFQHCRRILRDDHAADDVTQTVFMKLWRYGGSFRAAESPLAWLYRTAERCCFDELRRRRAYVYAAVEEQSDGGRPTCTAEDRDLMHRFLGRFEDRVKRVAVMRYCEGMGHAEIADETKWSRQTVFKKLLLLQERAAALRVTLCADYR